MRALKKNAAVPGDCRLQLRDERDWSDRHQFLNRKRSFLNCGDFSRLSGEIRLCIKEEQGEQFLLSRDKKQHLEVS